MRRLHLFEFEDLTWYPAPLRNLITDFLRDVLVLGRRVYDPAIPLIARVLEASRSAEVVDLCSGGTGPWRSLKGPLDELCGPVSLVFTDRYPNLPAFRLAQASLGPGRVRFESEPVDAASVDARLGGVRTMFTCLHHFAPESARRTLADAFNRRTGICVFEFTERSLGPVVGSLLLAPLMVLLMTPQIRPLTLSRLLFTYLVPVAPLTVTWDAVASNLRTYSPRELRTMVGDLVAPDYRWEIGRLPGRGLRPRITFILGYPQPTDGPVLPSGDA